MNLYKTPNPGSPEAIEQGCKCPRYDNCHGDGYSIDRATGEPLFVQNGDCPLHGVATEEEPAPAIPTSAERCPACNGRMGIVGEQAFCSRCPNIEDRPEFLQPATQEENK